TWLQWDETKQNFAIWLTARQQFEVFGTFYGALRTGAQNPACGPFPPNRVLPIKYGSFTVAQASGGVSLQIQYADGSTCQLAGISVETADSRTGYGYVHAVFDSAATAACPEFPAGLDLHFNGERLYADARDLCSSAHVMAAK